MDIDSHFETHTYYHKYMKFFFGLISINHIIEDRRPDFGVKSPEALKLGYKYKHFLTFRFFWKRINCYSFRTHYPYELFEKQKGIFLKPSDKMGW